MLKKILCVYALVAALNLHATNDQQEVELVIEASKEQTEEVSQLATNEETKIVPVAANEETKIIPLATNEETKIIPGALICDCDENKCKKSDLNVEEPKPVAGAFAHKKSEEAADNLLACI